MNFQYRAISRTGERLSGEIEAATPQAAIENLRNMGHLPIDVVTRGKPSDATSGNGVIGALGAPRAHQITMFTRELAMLLKAGLPLDRSLQLLRSDASSKKLATLIDAISKEIAGGKSLSEALGKQGNSFPPFYTSMVKVAEASGTLESVLERIAVAREKSQKLRSKALSDLLYPCMLIVMAIAAIVVMLTFVVPRFKDMVFQSGTEIPEQARLVFGASDWLIANGMALLVGLLIGLSVLAIAWNFGVGRRKLGQLVLSVPFVGKALKLALTISFCRGLGTMLENGVELPVAIRLLRDITVNPKAEAMLDEAYDAIRKGRSFLDPIANANIFPPVAVSMLRVGEESGGLAPSCLHLADMFEDKLEAFLQRVFTIIEPLIILFVSVFIAGIIISVLGAVMSLNELAI